MSTYNVTVTNLYNCPKITLSFDIEEKDFVETAAICRAYFPSVEIIDNDTGEVIFTYYNSRQPFYPNLIRDILDMIDPYIIKPEVQ